ncbi:sodium:calcium antiporter [Saccharolobus solfataricus]|uniref:Na(+)/Ca(2+) exchanging protein related n=3 Tax=Saccharolobus solfataricus TaxID=2287 RepID=Q97YX8_SACS2|nr:sodium:calcium antiporter [Saccharolobus solfataricus]AAK41422.1 Na(+)/Ca(2+) exchanging protein related [Saccharolobus solfataricus P2]AKA74361.1 sodium:calcium antiporter [Saccharolobus solfataricus]AKA77057.1 sodium:calcium antiporter [Saccharolobus solfataricus]AKA79749.1 sodium:calcium antiporter [Saccharolobus solfataricus]AZF68844.1 sodium:calcium antiporter [Saccharolobus solfataricus]
MLLFWLEFIGIFIAIFVSAELLAKGADELEDFLGQGITGGIILGFLTALPETIFVIVASLEGSFDVALGSAIGGNVLLFTLGIGLVGVFYAFKWRTALQISSEYSVENVFLVLTTIGMLLVLIYGKLNIISGLLLILIYVIYVVYRVAKFRREGMEREKGNLMKPVGFIIAGGVLLVVFSHYFVEYINEIAIMFNVPAIWLSLVIAPIAGELEEKISAFRLVLMSKDGGSLSILSFVGSKIENATVLLGIIGIFTDYELQQALPEYASSLIANMIALYVLFDKRLKTFESVILIGVYVIIVILSFYL